MGHIQRRAKDKWRARYIGPDGRERSKTFSRKTDAERYLATVEASKVRGDWVDPRLGRTTFAHWAKRWFGTISALKPKTRAGYESLLRTVIFPTFDGAQLAQIQPVDVREWVSKLTANGLSPSRIRQAYHLFGAIMRSAVESGYIARSPCVGVKLPRMTQREMLFLSADQVNRLADEIAQPYKVLVLTLAYGGMRWGEAAALRRSRCDLLHSKLEIRESLARSTVSSTLGLPRPTQLGACCFLRSSVMRSLNTSRNRSTRTRTPSFLQRPTAALCATPHGIHASGRRRFGLRGSPATFGSMTYAIPVQRFSFLAVHTSRRFSTTSGIRPQL